MFVSQHQNLPLILMRQQPIQEQIQKSIEVPQLVNTILKAESC